MKNAASRFAGLVLIISLTAPSARGDGAVLQWARTYDGPDNLNDFAPMVTVDPGGNVVVAAISFSGDNREDFYTAKYAAAGGTLLWEVRYDGPAHLNDEPYAVAVDEAGNVFVTGTSIDVGGLFFNDIYTAKYAAATGALLWERRYHRPDNQPAISRAVVADANGNAIITGETNGRLYTAKYAAADGAVLWENDYASVTSDPGFSGYLALDGGGNVLVAGSLRLRDDDQALFTAKLAATNGAVIWTRRDPGPRLDDDTGMSAMTVDAGSNVIITGILSGGAFYTAKYAATDGARLWEKYHDSGGNTGDVSRAVAVDAGGNVFVTGETYGEQQDDFLTVKYAAADGALLWERRYDGPVNGPYGDVAMGVVVGRTRRSGGHGV